MWKLSPEGDGGNVYYLPPGETRTVGRKNCSLLLVNDQSISRLHAQLSASPASLPGTATLTLTDSSKYGTFVNGEKLENNVTKTLKAGDLVTFGVFQSKFRVEFEAFLVCSSRVDNKGKASLAEDVQMLGGKLLNTWSQDCTHLVIPTIKVNIKTVCALLCCRPIVKPEFFSVLKKALQEKSPLPKVEHFCPEIDEPSLEKGVDLCSRPERKTLFQGKTFVFLNSKQLKRLSLVVAFGGGRVQLLEEGSLPTALLESAQSCVVDMATASSQTESVLQWYNSVSHVLQRKGLRMITESELGLATLYATTRVYCNPSARVTPGTDTPVTKPELPSGTLSQNTTVDETVLLAASQNITAYAPDTQPSQGVSRLNVSGPTEVAETPEKEQRQSGHKEPAAANPRIVCMSTLADDVSAKERSEKAALGPRHSGNGQTTQMYSSTSRNKSSSPQKQSNSLTNYFQPVSKKRTREGCDIGNQSKVKLSKREEPQQQEEAEKEPDLAMPRCIKYSKNTTAPPKHESSILLPESKGEVDAPGQDRKASPDSVHPSFDSGYRPVAGKRKQMDQTDPKEESSLDMDVDDLESIMSTPMEDQDEHSTESKRKRVEPLEDVKNEIMPFGGVSKENRKIIPEQSEPQGKSFSLKAEAKDGKALLAHENGEDLPKNVMLVQFASLVMDSSQRPKIGRQQSQMMAGKNFKQFRKVSVPGSSGLPRIIGGSDLVAHNRTRNAELEEWLREAAEEDSRNERDDAIGDDLFRYNPKPFRRR